jgi:1,4-dihydroxy-6-naphthoate synthase
LRALSLGYSPCPNDTFIFYAMTHGVINTDHLKFNEVLLDVEALNQKALKAELDITKISYHAFGHLRDNYCLLSSGGALGRGCGPLVISKNKYSMNELKDRKIAIPGKLTTAYMLLQLYDSAFRFDSSRIFIMPFDRIMESIAGGETDAGLIIHESRFTYPSYGLTQVIDLGQWWENKTGLPIPLGGIIANRSFGKEMIRKIDTVLKNSVEYAFNHRSEPLHYVKQNSQELSDEVIEQHINLYVNDFSLGLGEEGQMAVTEFLMRAESSGIIPESKKPVFI